MISLKDMEEKLEVHHHQDCLKTNIVNLCDVQVRAFIDFPLIDPQNKDKTSIFS